MRRTFGTPLVIALLAGPITWLIQNVFRPAAHAHPVVLWLLGPAPNVVVGLCFPFAALGYPFESLSDARRGVAAAAVLTVAILIAFEVWRPIPGARTYDPLDIVGSVLGGLVGTLLAQAVARRRYAHTGGARPSQRTDEISVRPL